MLSPVAVAKRQLTLNTHRIHSLPVVVLMAHSRCNCRCVMCDIWKANRNGVEMTREALEPHVEVLKKLNTRWVTLTGGEALMHSNLWTLCELLKTLPVKITLLTTGLLLDRHAADVTRWCDEAIVSLDGSKDVHDGIRNVPHAYERLARGVNALKDLNSEFPVSARCVIQRGNYFDLPNIVEAAREIGVDHISFLAADVSSTAFNRPTPWGDERVDDIALSPHEVAEFHRIVEELIPSRSTDFESGFIAESPDKLRRLPRYFAALNGIGDFPTTVCNAPWVSTVIESDGTVRPCYFHAPLGNIGERSLGDILNSEDAITFRRRLDVTTDAICRKCVCTLHIGARASVGL